MFLINIVERKLFLKGSIILEIQAHGKSNAKIILIGEHAVVYGQPAIALPLTTVTVNVTLEKISNLHSQIKSNYYTGPLTDLPLSMNGVKHLIKYLIQQLKIEDPLLITIDSQLPAERGMGSSAAVAIALIRAFYAYTAKPLTKTHLLNLANIAEKDTHKNPSGLDAATCASQEPIWMIRNQELTNMTVNLPGFLVICDSGIKGRTSEAIMCVKDQLCQDPESTHKLIKQLGQLTYDAKDALEDSNIELLGKIFNKAQAKLKQLDVSCPQLDKLIKLSLANGSLGSKLTGGGKGGCFINLVSTKKDAQQLANTMLKNGVTQTWIEPLFKEEK